MYSDNMVSFYSNNPIMIKPEHLLLIHTVNDQVKMIGAFFNFENRFKVY